EPARGGGRAQPTGGIPRLVPGFGRHTRSLHPGVTDPRISLGSVAARQLAGPGRLGGSVELTRALAFVGAVSKHLANRKHCARKTLRHSLVEDRTRTGEPARNLVPTERPLPCLREQNR